MPVCQSSSCTIMHLHCSFAHSIQLSYAPLSSARNDMRYSTKHPEHQHHMLYCSTTPAHVCHVMGLREAG